jgi:hypothetical protein
VSDAYQRTNSSGDVQLVASAAGHELLINTASQSSSNSALVQSTLLHPQLLQSSTSKLRNAKDQAFLARRHPRPYHRQEPHDPTRSLDSPQMKQLPYRIQRNEKVLSGSHQRRETMGWYSVLPLAERACSPRADFPCLSFKVSLRHVYSHVHVRMDVDMDLNPATCQCGVHLTRQVGAEPWTGLRYNQSYFLCAVGL